MSGNFCVYHISESNYNRYLVKLAYNKTKGNQNYANVMACFVYSSICWITFVSTILVNQDKAVKTGLVDQLSKCGILVNNLSVCE